MPPKKALEPERKPLIGRVGTNLRVGIVGIPNVGKSTFFNVLTKSAVAAENFPFCTIDPNENKFKNKMTDFYVRENHELKDFKCDTNVIGDKHFFKYISGVKYKEDSLEVPISSEWYPLCNSYYPYTEDVDAVNRVPHLIASKKYLASFTNLEREPKVKYAYDTDEAQIQYLKSKPVVFLILGKPNIGEHKLGKLLAEHWKCVYIDPEILVDEEIQSGSRAGQCIEFNLRCGRAVAVDVILRLLEKRVKSKSAQHRGFVLCGFPLIRNDMYQDDPVSSESAVFTAQEIFEEVIEATVTPSQVIRNVSQISHLSKESEPTTPAEESVHEVDKPEEQVDKDQTEEKPASIPAQAFTTDIGSTTSNICKITNIGTNYSEQLMFVFSLCREPLIIIYIMCQNADVIKKHENYRYNLNTHEFVNLQKDRIENVVYTLYTKTPGFDNEELPDDLPDNMDEYPLDLSSSERKYLTHLPSDFAGNVAAQLEQYLLEALPTIEKRVLLHDPQYFIKLDGRMSPSRMFSVVKTKLRILPIPRVVIPEKLIDPYVPMGGEDDLNDDEDIFENKSPEECFEELRKRKLINRMFKLKWSKWGTYCPVAVHEGAYVEGQSKYAAKFFDRIFFLSSEDTLTKFTRNPRIYLLPPDPKPSCKIFIIGPKASGKTALANCLALFLNGQVLESVRLKEEYFARKRKQFLDQIRTEAINTALIELQELRQREYEQLEMERKENIPKWLENLSRLIEERLLLDRLMRTGLPTVEITAFPLPSIQKKEIDPEKVAEYKDQSEALKQKFLDVDLPFFLDVDLCKKLSDEPKLLINYLPEYLKNETPPPQPASVFDDFVQESAEKAVATANYNTVEMSLDDMVDMYTTAVKEQEEENKKTSESRDGWIIDSVFPDAELLENLIEKCKPADIFLLRAPDKTFLVDRFRVKGQNEFRNYREFFYELGRYDIALKSPSSYSTMSYKTRVARDVIDDMLNDEHISGGEFPQDDEEEMDEFVDVDYFATHATRIALAQYENDITEYEKLCEDLINYFIEGDILFTEINVADKSLPQLMREAIGHISSRFQVTAHEFTPEERIQEVEDFGEADTSAEGLGEEDEEEETLKGGDAANSFYQNRRFGDTNQYCPVTFHDYWVLKKGKEEYAAKYDDKLYFLCNEDALTSFIKNPQNYLDRKPPRSFPPPRICVVGAAGSGKTTLANYLSRVLGLHYVSYENILKGVFVESSNSDLISLIHEHRETPEADTLDNYLISDQPLPEELLENINLKRLWYDEPIKFDGFVLDDYPKRPSDIEYMQKHFLIPDIVLELRGTDVEINKRRVQALVDDWREKTSKAQEERDRINRDISSHWEAKRESRIEELREIKRQQRFQAKMNEKQLLSDSEVATSVVNDSTPNTDRSQISYDSVAEEADLEEVLKQVALELPQPVFEDNWETLEDATQRIIDETENAFAAYVEFCGQMKQYYDAELISWVPLDADLPVGKVYCQAMMSVDEIKFRNKSLFERCYDVTLDLAEQLLESGYYFLSNFGRVCPVQMYENVNPLCMFLPLEQKFQLCPVLHRSYVYFLTGKENRDKFYSNPLMYAMQKDVKFPLVPFRMAVTGPPKCGKTVLSERFKRDMGLKHVSIGQAVRYVLRFLPYSILAERLETVLRNGWELTSEMTMKCVEAVAFDSKSVTQGMVFDGFPNSIEDVRHLAEIGMVPHLVIDLDASIENIYAYLGSDVGKRGLPPFSKKFINHRRDEWLKDSEKFRAWLDKEYQILAKIPVNSCKWAVWTSAYELASSVLFEIKYYYKNCDRYIGLRLANMNVTPSEFLERQSSFKHYCPCCLQRNNLLVSGGEPPDRTGVVQFLNEYYWLCDDHINDFIDNPEMHLSPYNDRTLPQNLPVRKSITEKPAKCYENGICIVCYWENQPQRVLNDGSLSFACTYLDRTYLFDSENCLKKFLTSPWQFFNKVINFKQTRSYASLKLESLPVLGMLEQYLGENIVKAVTNTGIMRPVLAGLSIEQSAALNIGLHLKLNNPKTPKNIIPVYEKANQLFRKRRLWFINKLAEIKRTINPYLYYEEPLQMILPVFDKENTLSERVSSSSEMHDGHSSGNE